MGTGKEKPKPMSPPGSGGAPHLHILCVQHSPIKPSTDDAPPVGACSAMQSLLALPKDEAGGTVWGGCMALHTPWLWNHSSAVGCAGGSLQPSASLGSFCCVFGGLECL